MGQRLVRVQSKSGDGTGVANAREKAGMTTKSEGGRFREASGYAFSGSKWDDSSYYIALEIPSRTGLS